MYKKEYFTCSRSLIILLLLGLVFLIPNGPVLAGDGDCIMSLCADPSPSPVPVVEPVTNVINPAGPNGPTLGYSASHGSCPSNQHQVAPGETLGIISQQYGHTIADLQAANGISNPNLIYVGQCLTVWGISAANQAPPQELPPSNAELSEFHVSGDCHYRPSENRYYISVYDYADLPALTNVTVSWTDGFTYNYGSYHSGYAQKFMPYKSVHPVGINATATYEDYSYDTAYSPITTCAILP